MAASGSVPPYGSFPGIGERVVVIVASMLVPSAADGKPGVIGRAVRRLQEAKARRQPERPGVGP